jgi:hypothetical protein
MNNFQLNKISKEAFAKERSNFLRFFAIFMFILIGLFCVLLRTKEPYMYLGAAFLYFLAIAFSIRVMTKEYKLTPLYVKVDGRYIDICHEHSSFQISLDEIDYIAQVYIRSGIWYRDIDVFRGHSKGKEFYFRYKYLEGYYLIKQYIKEEWIDKKDEFDFKLLKKESKTYELKDERVGYIRIENIKSLQLLSESKQRYVELHVYNDKNKKYVFKYAKRKWALIIIKCYKIESLYNIPFKWQNNSYVPFFEDKLSTIYKKNGIL